MDYLPSEVIRVVHGMKLYQKVLVIVDMGNERKIWLVHFAAFRLLLIQLWACSIDKCVAILYSCVSVFEIKLKEPRVERSVSGLGSFLFLYCKILG